ncbi:hypothetical protein BRARA_K00841 [Brassica rapa]|uniref:Uncharacterized protein n=1 Tax=Brassica campestris TaxID=3711 RepID=A0A397KZ47_BRACM|nr:hypothetical protein BRARA_K00841 [Brassica rapa]CAG7884752.1 unnamed protein product [Brassica rapa]VDC83803.1 unnamed protein product [Brassica rapa]
MEASHNSNLQTHKLTKQLHHLLEVEQYEEEEDKEETLSLRDLPLLNDNKPSSTATTTTTEDHGEPWTEPFEFLTSTSYDVSPAENIIYRGKIIPLNYKNALFSPPEHISPRVRTRSESLSAIQGNKLNPPLARDIVGPMRTSRSLDDRKLTRRLTTADPPPEKVSSTKSTVKTETVSSGSGKSVRPRWYVIMFGIVKFPPEIELRNIKSRKTRRNVPPVMFPSLPDRRSRATSPSPSWRFLNALSCKEPTSVAATAPLWVPHA